MNSLTSRISVLTSRLYHYAGSRPLLKDTITTTTLSTLGKGVGFLVPFFIAAWFGVSGETDAFFFAYGLILFLATMFSPVVETVIVPFIAGARAKNEDVGVFVGRVLGMSAVGLTAISVLFFLIIKPILATLTKFSSEELNLVYWILLESAPLMVLLVWTSILAGTLNAYRVFGIPAVSPAFRAIVTLVFIFAFREQLGVHAIAWGYVIGEASRLSTLFVWLRKLNIFHLKFSIGWEPKFAEFFKTSSYQIVGMSMLAFTPIINKTMASWLGPGNVSLLEYADRLYMIPSNLVSTGLIVTLLSHWSERYYSGGEERLKKDVWKAAKVVGFIGIALTLLLFSVKGPLVGLVYGHGKFPKGQVEDVERILGFYLLGLTPHILSQVYSKTHLIRMDTKIIFYTAVSLLISTILLNLILIPIMGIEGIALAASLVALLSLSLMSRFFYNRHRGDKTKSVRL